MRLSVRRVRPCGDGTMNASTSRCISQCAVFCSMYCSVIPGKNARGSRSGCRNEAEMPIFSTSKGRREQLLEIGRRALAWIGLVADVGGGDFDQPRKVAARDRPRRTVVGELCRNPELLLERGEPGDERARTRLRRSRVRVLDAGDMRELGKLVGG